VPLLQDLKTDVDKIADVVEAKVEDFDGKALADLRQLAADAVTAETQVVAVIDGYKSALATAVAKYGPVVAEDLLPDAEKLLADIKALFGLV
jgi:hypothetical protein